MDAKKFIKSFFNNYFEQDVPVEMDLWPAIMSRFQNSGEEGTGDTADAGRDGLPQLFMEKLPELLSKSTNSVSSKQKESAMDKEKQGDSGTISRQGFLKISGATAAAAAVVGAARRPVLRSLEEIGSKLQTSESGEQIYRNVCRPNCVGYCGVDVHVRDGKIVKTSMAKMPDPRYERICLRGLAHVQRVYDPERIKYPMKRAGERGENKWERISWEEAITTITDQWKSIQEKYGKQALAFQEGSGNLTLLNKFPGFLDRLRNLIGGTANVMDADNALGVGINRVTGGNPFAAFPASEAADLLNARVIFIWGWNVTDASVQNWRFVADAKERGAKVVVIDPIFTQTASKADRYVRIRPGSDPALMLSMMQIIIDEELYDKQFVLEHTVGPFLVREDNKKFLRMSDLGVEPTEGPADAYGNPTKIDPCVVWDPATLSAAPAGSVSEPLLEGSHIPNGISVRTAFDLLKEEVNKYPPEVGSKLTDVDVDTIRELAMLELETPVSNMNGFGPQAYGNGAMVGHAVATLASLTGNIGKAGATVGYLWHYLPYVNWTFMFPTFEFGPSVPDSEFPTVVETGMYGGQPFPIKAFYVCMGNKLTTGRDRNVLVNKVFPKLDLIVVADMVFTDTARYADIVLPVPHWFEQEDVASAGGTNPYLQIIEKAIEPLYESKPDTEIFRLLAQKMGIGDYFSKTDAEYADEMLDTEMVKQLGITLATIKEKKAIRYLPDPFIMYEGQKYLTPSGRLEFYVEDPKPRVDFGQTYDKDRERLPRFFPPLEAWPDNPLHEKYPLVVLSVRPRFRVHSQWFAAPWLRELDPDPIFRIHPSDAAKRGIVNGDIVEVFNDRGHAVAKAVVSEIVKPGVINYIHGWQRHQMIAGSFPELTSSEADPVAMSGNFMDVLGELRKWNGEV